MVITKYIGKKELKMSTANDGDPIQTRELRCEKFGLGITPVISTHSLSCTNWTTIASINCNGASNDQLSDMVGFILTVLHQYNLCQGTVAA